MVFERFNNPARSVITAAQEEARALGHFRIGTSHLLLGALHGDSLERAMGPSDAQLACDMLGIEYGQIRSSIAQVLGDFEQKPSGYILFTDTAKQAILSANQAALSRNDATGTGHVLLGLASDDAADPPRPRGSRLRSTAHGQDPAYYDIAHRLLIDAAGTLERVRDAVEVILSAEQKVRQALGSQASSEEVRKSVEVILSATSEAKGQSLG